MGLFDLEGALGFYGQDKHFIGSLWLRPYHAQLGSLITHLPLPPLLPAGSYHNNRMNQLIHVIFVPCIVWSAMVIFNYISLDLVLGHHVYLFGSKAAVSHPWLQLVNDNIVLGGGLALFLLLSIYYLTLTMLPAIHVRRHPVRHAAVVRLLLPARESRVDVCPRPARAGLVYADPPWPRHIREEGSGAH